MVNTENQIDYTVAQGGEAVHSQNKQTNKQDLELTVA